MFASISNLTYIESLYQQFLENPNQVDRSWRLFFEGFNFANTQLMPASNSLDLRIYLLLDAYRTYGHLMAKFNPIDTIGPKIPNELNLNTLGFTQSELDSLFPTCGFLDKPQARLKDLIQALQTTYCGSIGIEYMGLGEPALQKWLQEQIEPYFPLRLNEEDKIWILNLLNKAELFEAFIHLKYVGQKRFSLEGGETLIPMLAAILEKGAQLGIETATLGMAHRGRLNVLANILNKSYSQIFHEFESHYSPEEFEGTGDVKYHKGFFGNLKTRTGKTIDLTLVANPSHLEAVNPIVEGIVRAQQELKGNKSHRKDCLPILIHGDASVAGQGVVYETLQLSRLNGYATGGTLHLVVNNQIGFTTLPKDARSTRYCTDIGKAFGAPVFHVNAEDPEACVRAAILAIEIRQRFECDVFIDLNCYRKYGHNESDEPTFTQPLEYSLIKQKKTIRELYKEKLIQNGVLDAAQSEILETEFKDNLHRALETIPEKSSKPSSAPQDLSEHVIPVKTQVDAPILTHLTEIFCTIPPDLKIHPKVAKGVHERAKMIQAPPQEAHIDWGMAEHLAYASLLIENIHIRISGQDVRRGTFSHRHAIWVDQVKEWRYFPLAHLRSDQKPFDIFNSPLSEFAVLGFEFGYSLTYPNSLVIWEAQFGDFANGAQVIIDQFIASSEQKWKLSSNLTLFLPHGYEGQGPEHSSARIERFLQLCGHDNMRIVNCSTPAQLFHMLRFQALSTVKKPLILFTPKVLLRHGACLSSLNSLTQGRFQEVIDDSVSISEPSSLYFCTGKLWYDLVAYREKIHFPYPIIRIEQLFPFPKKAIESILNTYSKATNVYWVQEEHSNMGAWEYIEPLMNDLLGKDRSIQYIGRDRSASPAAGSFALHKKQWEEIIQRMFGSVDSSSKKSIQQPEK